MSTKPVPREAGGEKPLDSWKDIAAYLNRDVRTAQRWERERGLPVRRLPGEGKAAVYALRSELDGWLRSGAARAPRTGQSSGPASIAVLPFANLSPDKDNEYIGDGLAEDIINALTQVPGLRVMARTSSFSFRGQERDVREIGRKLDVGTLLEGSVRRSGGSIRVAAQLVSCADGFHLWSHRYDREVTDLFAIQDEISQAIVDGLRVSLGRTGPLVRAQPANIEAYQLCLQGRYWSARLTPASVARSRACFERAIRLDASYAQAYLGLAEHHLDRALFGVCRPVEAYAEAKAAVSRALELDDGLGEAHSMRGAIHAAAEFHWTAAEREFQRALELSPASPAVHSRYAWYFLTPKARLEEAQAELELALDRDPLSPMAHEELGRMLMFRRRYEQAEQVLQKAIALDPTSPAAHASLAATYLFQGKMGPARAAAEEMARLAGEHPEVIAAQAAQQAMAGDPGAVREASARLREMSAVAYVSPLALAWLAMVTRDEAVFDWLAKAVEERDPQVLHLAAKPLYDGLRPHPRFQAVLGMMGLEA